MQVTDGRAIFPTTEELAVQILLNSSLLLCPGARHETHINVSRCLSLDEGPIWGRLAVTLPLAVAKHV